jgi:hypothetical protein
MPAKKRKAADAEAETDKKAKTEKDQQKDVKAPAAAAASASAAAPAAEEQIAPETDTQAKNQEKGVVLNPGFIRRPHTRILVTGGAGFIGSHMCDFLLKDPTNLVICVDNCFSGNKSNIQHLLSNPRFEFIRHGTATCLSGEESSNSTVRD